MSQREKLIGIVRETQDADTRLLAAVVYGSAAKGTFRPESDVDVAVLCAARLTTDERVELATRLEERLHRTVDLVDLRSASGLLLKEILTTGVSVIRRDADQWVELLKRMVYEQEDFMPYYRRLLKISQDIPTRLISGKGPYLLERPSYGMFVRFKAPSILLTSYDERRILCRNESIRVRVTKRNPPAPFFKGGVSESTLGPHPG